MLASPWLLWKRCSAPSHGRVLSTAVPSRALPSRPERCRPVSRYCPTVIRVHFSVRSFLLVQQDGFVRPRCFCVRNAGRTQIEHAERRECGQLRPQPAARSPQSRVTSDRPPVTTANFSRSRKSAHSIELVVEGGQDKWPFGGHQVLGSDPNRRQS